MLCVSIAGFAQSKGLYLGGNIGASKIESSDSNIDNRFSSGTFESGVSHSFGNQNDDVFSGGLSIGYDFSPEFNLPIRTELSYTARGDAKTTKSGTHLATANTFTTDLKHSETLGVQTLMANVWIDIPNKTKFTPYVGAGVGAAFVKYDYSTDHYFAQTGQFTGNLNGSARTTNTAWLVGVGVNYKVNPNWAIDLGYRYLDAGDVTATSRFTTDSGGVMNSKSKTKVSSNEVFLGARYTF